MPKGHGDGHGDEHGDRHGDGHGGGHDGGHAGGHDDGHDGQHGRHGRTGGRHGGRHDRHFGKGGGYHSGQGDRHRGYSPFRSFRRWPVQVPTYPYHARLSYDTIAQQCANNILSPQHDLCQGDASCQMGVVWAVDPSTIQIGLATNIAGEAFQHGAAMQRMCVQAGTESYIV
jgi:hypothetical protein